MTFNPNSTIYLCNVPIDNTYKNQLRFNNLDEQYRYFVGRVKHTFTNYLTVRKTNTDGSMVSSVKVDCNIDDLYDSNYMFYQNQNHGTKWFYAFIVKLIYINEGTTEIVFETDVWQTWFKNITLKPSFVVREHSESDYRGENIVPEKFNFDDYEYTKYPDGVTWLGEMGYLVASTDYYDNQGNNKVNTNGTGGKITNVFQGLYFYYFSNTTEKLNTFLKNIDTDCIVSITAIPYFNVSHSPGLAVENEGFIGYSSNVPTWYFNFDLSTFSSFDGYFPKNNKLFSSPFCSFFVTNNNGEYINYNIEDFDDLSDINFTAYGDISVSPSITLVPKSYKNVDENYLNAITIRNFPQCSFNSDTFKLWLARNAFGMATNTIKSVGEIIGGVAMVATGAGAVVGGGMIAHGASGVLNTMNDTFQHAHDANQAHLGNATSNLLTAINKNKFDFYIKTIKRKYAEMVDEFFTMYGYATNRVKVPNISSRPFYNYVQTIDCNIVGGIPDDDMVKMKNMFNGGVTFWSANADFGNYNMDEQDNRTTKR